MTLEFSRVTLAGPLWTVDEAKTHLRILDSAHDQDIAQKLEAAEEWVLAYLGPAGDATWTPTTAPKLVKHMILLLLAYYYEQRGDNVGPNTPDEPAIFNLIRHNLSMYRDVGIA